MTASKISFSTYLLIETPIGDYQTFGDFSKSSSFKDKRDRMLIQHPKSIERMKKKFGNTPYNFNLFFVNSPKARQHQEVGLVNLDYVRKNLGDEVANAVQNSSDHDDSINVVFTNNNGSERMPFTAWIAAHRLGHAFAREKGMRSDHNQYKSASDHLIQGLANIMADYGQEEFPNSERKMTASGWGGNEREKTRVNQLAMIHFFQNVATFKSARDHNLRDWFEVLNELIAQYLTTGSIKFNKAPQSFGGRARKYYVKDAESANEQLETLARDMQYMIDGIMSSVVGGILVM